MGFEKDAIGLDEVDSGGTDSGETDSGGTDSGETGSGGVRDLGASVPGVIDLDVTGSGEPDLGESGLEVTGWVGGLDSDAYVLGAPDWVVLLVLRH